MGIRGTQQLLEWNAPQAADELSVHDPVELEHESTGSGAPSPSTPEFSPAAAAETTGVARLTREQVIDEIITHNPSAGAEFLDGFSEPRLRIYLTRLRSPRRGRGRDTRWLRPGDSPAIVARERLL